VCEHKPEQTIDCVESLRGGGDNGRESERKEGER